MKRRVQLWEMIEWSESQVEKKLTKHLRKKENTQKITEKRRKLKMNIKLLSNKTEEPY